MSPDDEEDDYEAMLNRISSANEKVINKFAEYLQIKKLSKKTIEKHCSNISFYGNDYIANYSDDKATVDKASLSISGFLGSWFIRKCMWSSEAVIKEYITSFKKFYGWLHETKALSTEDHDEFLQMLKEEKDQWLETMRKYNDPDTDFEDVFSDYF